MFRRAIARIKAWLFRKDPPGGGGPGGSTESEAFTDARARTDWNRFGSGIG